MKVVKEYNKLEELAKENKTLAWILSNLKKCNDEEIKHLLIHDLTMILGKHNQILTVELYEKLWKGDLDD